MKTVLKRKRRRPRVGDLRDRVKLQVRTVSPPDVDEYDLDHVFADSATVWASVETLSGDTLFDEVAGVDVLVSHRIVIRKLAGVSAETWCELEDGTRLDVLAVEDLDERGEFVVLTARRTGPTTREAAQA